MSSLTTETHFGNPIHTALKSFFQLGELLPIRLGQKTTTNEVEVLERLVNISTSTSESVLIGAQSSTSSQEVPQIILDQLYNLFDTGKEEIFEDGIQTQFSRTLIYYIEGCGDVVIDALTQLISGEQVSAEVASEALRWIGRMKHPLSLYQRLLLLERSLSCRSPRVRDGAILGLAAIDEPSAIPYLEQAIEREEIDELRQDMEQVLDQLRATELEKFA